ncbi:MAG: nitrate- and nitrite sensing domain-containing protein, partial [Acidimicrobiia bacterium]
MFGVKQRHRDRTTADPTEAEVTVSARLGIRSKLAIMVVGPVIVLLAVLFTQISGRISVLNDVHELSESIPILKQSTDLVHEIQTERGLSALFLSSGGTAFEGQLEEQYLRTDESAALLTKSILRAVRDGEQFLEPLELHDGTPLLQASNPLDIFPNLENLDAHRANVRGLDSDELDSLIFYSSVNDGLLKMGPELTRWSPDAEIVSLIWAHNSLAKATESAGLERAVLGRAIAAGRLPREEVALLSFLIGSQNAHLDVFLTHSTPESRELYQEKLSYAPTPEGPMHYHASSNIIAFREIALSDNLSDLNAREWWMTASLQIDALDDLETLLLGDILAKNLLLRSGARVNLAQFVMIGLL